MAGAASIGGDPPKWEDVSGEGNKLLASPASRRTVQTRGLREDGGRQHRVLPDSASLSSTNGPEAKWSSESTLFLNDGAG